VPNFVADQRVSVGCVENIEHIVGKGLKSDVLTADSPQCTWRVKTAESGGDPPASLSAGSVKEAPCRPSAPPGFLPNTTWGQTEDAETPLHHPF